MGFEEITACRAGRTSSERQTGVHNPPQTGIRFRSGVRLVSAYAFRVAEFRRGTVKQRGVQAYSRSQGLFQFSPYGIRLAFGENSTLPSYHRPQRVVNWGAANWRVRADWHRPAKWLTRGAGQVRHKGGRLRPRSKCLLKVKIV